MGTNHRERNKKYEARREKLHLPDGIDITHFVDIESKRTGRPKWTVLQDLYLFYKKHHPKTPEEQKVDLYNEFVKAVAESDPQLTNKLGILGKYIVTQLFGLEITEFGWKRVGRRQLDDEYFENLKKL